MAGDVVEAVVAVGQLIRAAAAAIGSEAREDGGGGGGGRRRLVHLQLVVLAQGGLGGRLRAPRLGAELGADEVIYGVVEVIIISVVEVTPGSGVEAASGALEVGVALVEQRLIGEGGGDGRRVCGGAVAHGGARRRVRLHHLERRRRGL